MVYINGVLINTSIRRFLMMCITLINGLVLINAYIGINHRLQNLLMTVNSLGIEPNYLLTGESSAVYLT